MYNFCDSHVQIDFAFFASICLNCNKLKSLSNSSTAAIDLSKLKALTQIIKIITKREHLTSLDNNTTIYFINATAVTYLRGIPG